MYNSYSVFVICHFTWSANPDCIRHNRKTTHWSVPTWGGPTKWTTNEINFTILRYFRSRKKDSFVRGFAWTQKHAGDQKHTKILARKVTISLAAGRKTENILIRKGVRVAQPLSQYYFCLFITDQGFFKLNLLNLASDFSGFETTAVSISQNFFHLSAFTNNVFEKREMAGKWH